jgi:peptide/nickel transport system permease protein
MRAYVLRRVLLMLPTFVGISLVVFLLLNLAPGRPGAQGEIESGARGEATEDSYRLFSEQFNLDKPILFNTRIWLTTDEVRRDLRVAAELDPVSVAERLAARQHLTALGNAAVPHLMAVMQEADAAGEHVLRDMAAYFLRSCAPRREKNPYDASPTPEQRAYNDGVAAERAALRPLLYAFDAPEADKRVVLDGWGKWYEGARSRFDHDAWERVRIFFLDTRFAAYWRNLLRLDFGISIATRQPVIPTLLSKLEYSLTLSFVSLVFAFAVSIPIGIFGAVRRGSAEDRWITLATFMLYSLPSFFIASVLLYFFSEGSNWPSLRIFPTGGFQSSDHADLTTLGKFADILWHLVLPVACLTHGYFAVLSRYMRIGLLEVIGFDYVRTARAKGLPEHVVIGKHALRNGLLPILTSLGSLLPTVLGGSVLIEYIFGIPGIGAWTINSIYQRDYNVIMGVQLMTTVLVLVGMLVIDIAYALIDPRIRYQ